jgi:hypothetical protein
MRNKYHRKHRQHSLNTGVELESPIKREKKRWIGRRQKHFIAAFLIFFTLFL